MVTTTLIGMSPPDIPFATSGGRARNKMSINIIGSIEIFGF